jgi:competence protein ComEC
MEALLVATATLRQTDVLKVPHHGSRSSSTEEFLSATRPAFALISAGYENPFRHPHPAVIERLNRAGAAVLRTDIHGLITARTDGRTLEVDTAAWRE